MTIVAFPPLDSADEDGLLAVGGDLEIDSLLLAYRSGIFPWPFSERQLAWFSPPQRGIVRFDDFHVSRSLRKERNDPAWSFSLDTRFDDVITACATSGHRPGQSGTWITRRMINGYRAFHRAGFAHSIECYYESELVGGLYGVSIGGFFAGESMFFTRSNASKLGLWYLVEYLRKRGATWLDCQMVTPVLESMGATLIPRAEFIELLSDAVAKPTSLFPTLSLRDPESRPRGTR